ncbi:MAG: hypothetical protein ACUZ77_09455 [Candidatus Brocadiales bacterium]
MDVDKPANHSSAEEKHYTGYGKMPWWLILLWVAFSAWAIVYIIRGLKG